MKAVLSKGKFPIQREKIEIGGSKSETNRLLILQALFENISISNLSESDDSKVLQEGLKASKGIVNVHHAGTAMRFLTSYFAIKEGADIILTGSKRMQQRPIGILVEALNDMGAKIHYLKEDGFPPIRIIGTSLNKSKVSLPSSISSQFITSLMLIAPILPEGLTILMEGEIVSKPYIEMTLSLLNKIGIDANFSNNKIEIPAVRQIEDIKIWVESDWSSASYFYSLVALSEDLRITLHNFSKESMQGDSILPIIYEKLGVETVYNSSEKSISLLKRKLQLPKELDLDLTNSPDLAQTIAVSCFGLGIGCHLKGLQTLKIKETDRLSASKKELTNLGARVQVDGNSLQLEKSSGINSSSIIETYQDHRMAMAFSPLAIKTDLIIENAEVVSKSYPKFWEDLKKTGVSCEFVDSSH